MASSTGTGVTLARVYGDSGRGAGDYRVLVDRLWPRGCSRAGLELDEWAKELAPSTELRRFYGHEPARRAAFAARYRDELAGPGAAAGLERLRALAKSRRLVLLTASRDLAGSGAAVLAAVLEHGDGGAAP